MCNNRYASSRSIYHAGGPSREFVCSCVSQGLPADHEAGDPLDSTAQLARCRSTLSARITVCWRATRASIWFGGAMLSGRRRRLVAESWSTEQSRVCVW